MDLIFANNQDLTNLVSILILNIFVVLFISKFIYLKFNNKSKKSLNEFFFTYNSAGLITFLLCFLLSNVKLDLGFALGLFAIFGIIRYRTLPLQTEEMTYLFVTIGVAVINALSEDFLTVYELIIINFIIILFILFCKYLSLFP